MRILFSVAHPAHVHLFKYPISVLAKRGYKVKVIAVEKEITTNLLNAYGIKYETYGKNVSGSIRKAFNLIKLDLHLFNIIKRFRPDILVSTGSPYLAQVGKVLGKPHISFGDTEIDRASVLLTSPFTAIECNPSCYQMKKKKNEVRYDGYHELAYLHPKYFTPDENVLDDIGIAKDERFIICRFVDWSALHDVGGKGAWAKTQEEKLSILKTLENHGRVFLTTETRNPSKFKKYLLPLQPHRLHDLLAFASLYIGEGATMASEAGVLGVPWVFVSTSRRGYLDDQEKNYALGWSVRNWKDGLGRAESILSKPREEIRAVWAKKREKLLNDKIDVTEFIVKFIEDWPESFEKFKR